MRFIVLRRWSITEGLVKEIIADSRNDVVIKLIIMEVVN